MSNDGTKLETLVKQIEELLLPKGFEVKARSKVFEDGVQIAEFDLQIRGKLGSTDIVWLIECRDRSETGSGAWIEQLVGRRDRFGFNKVTAVSTSGFTAGAAKYASERGIELRTVKEVEATDVAAWLGVQSIGVRQHVHALQGVFFQHPNGEPPTRVAALRKAVDAASAAAGGNAGSAPLLRAVDSGKVATPTEVFIAAVQNAGNLFDDVVPNGDAKRINLRAQYPSDQSHFVVDTEEGPVRIHEIVFRGELRIEEREVLHTGVKDYRGDGAASHIAQSVSFPFELQGLSLAVEMHNLGDSGQTLLAIRKIS